MKQTLSFVTALAIAIPFVANGTVIQSGYCWNDKIGWINMANVDYLPASTKLDGDASYYDGVYSGAYSPGEIDFTEQGSLLVSLDTSSGTGTAFPLTGQAFSTQIGWAVADHGGTDPAQVTYTGHLNGNFWSNEIGWIHCSASDVTSAYTHQFILGDDTDGNGYPDVVETAEGTDPNDNLDYPLPTDSDGDGYPDYIEELAGSDPNDPASVPTDTDGDGVPDVIEIMQGTDPNDINDYQDSDNGGVPDFAETFTLPALGVPPTDAGYLTDDSQDTDGDGISDYDEFLNGTDPTDPNDPASGSTASSGSSGGSSSSRYFCRDEKATNYTNKAGKTDNGLCKYDEPTSSSDDDDTPTVAPTSVCAPYLKEHIRLGANNNPVEVKKLERFLNDKQGEDLTVDGIYSQEDFEAVKRFQQKYKTEVLDIWGLDAPTGYVYLTTRNKINSFYCNKDLKCPVFVEHNNLSKNTSSTEVATTKVLLSELGFYNGTINSKYDQAMHKAMVDFQETFRATMLDPWNLKKGTGYKYKTTNRFLNHLVGCKLPPETLDNGVKVSF